MSDSIDNPAVTAAIQTLAHLDGQAVLVRAELARLRSELTKVQQHCEGARVAPMLEANEHLVIAALRAEIAAETALSKLDAMARSSQRDALTDTPNRTLMFERLQAAIATARSHGTGIALLFVDIDDFKKINDTLGHAGGDQVLQRVARRLESVTRAGDTVSRHGGEEFLVLLADLALPAEAGLIANTMLSALAAPALIDGHTLSLSASIGIAMYPADSEDGTILIRQADAAMYHSKRSQRGKFQFYRADMSHAADREIFHPDAARQIAVSRDLVPADHDLRFSELREANAKLVIAAVVAQELESQAEESNRAQVKLLATVAHELRNPLAPMRIAAELIHRGATDPVLLEKLQGIIRRQVAQMSRLVEDLLDGSRVSTGKFKLEFCRMEMTGVLNAAVESCRAAMDSRFQLFTLQLPALPVWILGDPVRLTQVFTNILDNATKYTPAGGEIGMTLSQQDRAITVSVVDSGIGITAAAMPHIFDLFVQDTRATAQHSGGLGIGLAVVRDLVEAHGGSVVALSGGTDLGSEFVVSLSLYESPAAEPSLIADQTRPSVQ